MQQLNVHWTCKQLWVELEFQKARAFSFSSSWCWYLLSDLWEIYNAIIFFFEFIEPVNGFFKEGRQIFLNLRKRRRNGLDSNIIRLIRFISMRISIKRVKAFPYWQLYSGRSSFGKQYLFPKSPILHCNRITRVVEVWWWSSCPIDMTIRLSTSTLWWATWTVVLQISLIG